MLTIYSAFWLRAGSQVSDSETLKFQSCSAAIKSSGTLVRGHLKEDLIVAQYLERIEAVSPKLNAIVQLTTEAALESARQSDAALARRNLKGPFTAYRWDRSEPKSGLHPLFMLSLNESSQHGKAESRERPPSCATARQEADGRMFWLTRNRFFGSYLAFTDPRRL